MIALRYFIAYVLVVSAIAVLLTVVDKRNARLHRWRIPERTLFFAALCGGSAAMWITMRLIRHKTKHKRFMLGLPVIFLLQCLLFYMVVKNGI